MTGILGLDAVRRIANGSGLTFVEPLGGGESKNLGGAAHGQAALAARKTPDSGRDSVDG